MEERLERLPVHVSFIMDGNGRWAKQRGKDRIYGHFEGVSSVRAVMEASVEWGIAYTSFFAFSEENWGRPDEEVHALMELMGAMMVKELPTFMDNNIRFLVLGNREHLSEKLGDSIDGIMSETAGNTGMTMILFLSYSGKWDIFQAARRMAHDLIENPGLELGVDDFSRYLVTAGIPDPDLLIRTSGEKRISNYLLWQSAYTEFVFTDTLWPDFRREQYRAALEEYASRDRRFGKVK
ncbi:MAG TPA: di-trans,poly-cis-decaprenylcistransferase [Candidatus Cryptobacteroides merdipullorum]|uniref:Isoprenyl transferase n=1 Tax=Candidatus Cryptobacteroides merdipullorum TaxID=2840771 RepID=A0A9D1GNR9_9BACT|nr:di-trans,poly-cis-decaprenylcistransferase [Candidatus Cryptobacteroides merdipullorum]